MPVKKLSQDKLIDLLYKYVLGKNQCTHFL